MAEEAAKCIKHENEIGDECVYCVLTCIEQKRQCVLQSMNAVTALPSTRWAVYELLCVLYMSDGVQLFSLHCFLSEH